MQLIDFLYFALVLIILLAIFGVFWLIGGFLLFRQVDRKLRRCPNCGKGGSGFINDTDIVPLGVQIERSGKETVRVQSEKVTDHFECAHCGHNWIRTFERKERQTMGEETA
jgi:predicted RNA-binding Zn-ribbon protein involved in translation (DUF1610 family)